MEIAQKTYETRKLMTAYDPDKAQVIVVPAEVLVEGEDGVERRVVKPGARALELEAEGIVSQEVLVGVGVGVGVDVGVGVREEVTIDGQLSLLSALRKLLKAS